MNILLDLDGVTADFRSALVEQYNFLTGEKIKAEDIKTVRAGKSLADSETAYKIVNSPGFMRNLKPIGGAIDGVNSLVGDGHNVIFVSNGSNCPTSGHEKRDWLKYYFGKTWHQYVPLILTREKQYVRGDILLDDTPRNLEHLFPDTKGLLFDAPYNKEETRFERIYDWAHFLDWVKQNK